MATGFEKIKANFKDNIRHYRQAAGLTQFELSIQADVTEDYIYYLEAGKRTPSLAILGRIADALKVEPYELLK